MTLIIVNKTKTAETMEIKWNKYKYSPKHNILMLIFVDVFGCLWRACDK